MNITILLAKPADAYDMAEVHSRSYEAAYKNILPMEFIKAKNAARLDLYQRIITNENNSQYVIQADGKTVGIMGIDSPKDDDADDSYYELGTIYLHPDYFHKGIGTQVVNFAFVQAQKLGKKFMNVWVFAENANSIKFYEKCGFIADGKSKILERGKPVECIRMKKDLSRG